MNTTIKTTDDYLATVPEKMQTALMKLRAIIRAAAPKAEEIITYGIPAFRDSYLLVGFGAAKKHCSFFVMSTSLMKEFKEELKGYDTASATIRFTPEKPLPANLIKKIVKERILENKERLLAKQLKDGVKRKK